MPEKIGIIRGDSSSDNSGDSWGVTLQQVLAASSADTASWMQQHTHLLKSDANSRVGLLQLQREVCYLKLYCYKSSLQKLLFRLGHGRPVRSFDIALELLAKGVPVPRPLACLSVPEGILLLTEGMPDGRNLNDLWREQPASDELRQLVHGAGESVARLHLAGYAHGDCKWSNLLWTGQQCYLVDLDGAGKAAVGSAKQARDLARFTLNAEELAIGPELYELFLGSYLQGVSISRSVAIDRMMPVLRMLRDRHVAKYGERGRRLL
jgi:tRNA A-37 threonylcarbamoyl transferase component Bud32